VHTYDLRRCSSCGTAALASPPRVDSVHGERQSSRRGARERVKALVFKIADRERLRSLEGLPRGGRVFEVGAGTGHFLVALHSAGYVAAGTEPGARPSIDLPPGVTLERRTLEQVAVPETSQDAVVFWHVLEHLDDPLAAVVRARSWLAPRGRIVVAVPNLGSLQAAMGGDRWFQWDVPRHVVHFTRAGLRALLDRAGFRVLRFRHGFFDQNLFAMWQTLLNRVTREPNVALRLFRGELGSRGSVVRDLAITTLAGIPLAVGAAALEGAAVAITRGGSVIAEAVPA
jgi:SAM-dependent methyltransferase